MPHPRHRSIVINLGGGHGRTLNQEYETTLDGKLVPINFSSPTYSRKTKQEIKRLKAEAKANVEALSSNVDHYTLAPEELEAIRAKYPSKKG